MHPAASRRPPYVIAPSIPRPRCPNRYFLNIYRIDKRANRKVVPSQRHLRPGRYRHTASRHPSVFPLSEKFSTLFRTHFLLFAHNAQCCYECSLSILLRNLPFFPSLFFTSFFRRIFAIFSDHFPDLFRGFFQLVHTAR